MTRSHAKRKKQKWQIPPWRGPMLLALAITLVAILVLQGKPHTSGITTKTDNSRVITTTQLGKSTLAISSGPTWTSLGTLQNLTLNTTSLASQSGISVSLEVFPKIESRSEFQYISKTGLQSLPIASSPAVSLTQLTQDNIGSPQLNFEISEQPPSFSSANSQQSTSYIQIPYCSPNCAGVYPLLAVFIKGSQIIGTALSRVVILPNTTISKALNFTLVVQSPFTGNTKNDLNALSLLTSAITANPNANLTLDIPGVILQEASGSTAPQVKTTVSQLLAWAQRPNHQIISSGFVPINLPQLASSGLSEIIPKELSAAKQESSVFLHQNLPSLGPMAIDGPLTPGTISDLTSSGVSKVLLGDKYFSAFSEKFTLSQPFTLEGNDGSKVTVLALDSGLGSDMTSKTLPYQAANQLSSDLAQIYFDQPNDTTPRIVSALFQVSDSEDAAKLDQILATVTSTPLVKMLDVNSAFSLIPRNNLSSGELSSVTELQTLNTGTYQDINNKILALDSSLGQSQLLTQASNDLLESVSSSLSPQTQRAFLSSSGAAVSHITQMISLATNKSFTVTSRNVRLPIAIGSELKVPFKGVLVINSDRLSFPNGNTVPVVLNGPNTTLSIPIYAETLGLYLISAKLFTMNGQLVVAHTSIEIRSTAFSVVSVILTLGAIFILALWWIQSLRRGDKRNKRLVGEKK